MQLRFAFLCGVAGIVFLLWWLCQSGVNSITAGVLLFFAIVVFTGLTRVVAQAGMAYGRPPVAVPAATATVLGTTVVGQGGLAAMGFSFTWGGDVRTSVMASSTNGLKVADAARVTGGKLYLAIALSCLVSLLAASWAFIRAAHQKGAVTLGGWHVVGLTQAHLAWVTNAINTHPGARFDRFGFMAVGALCYIALSALRDRFLWFPIHPIGLTLGLAGPFQWNFFPVFLAWVVKVKALRYSGAKGYATTQPFFLGLILGNFVSAGFWLIISGATGMPGMSFTGG